MWASIALALHLAAAQRAAPAVTVEVTGSGPAMLLVPGLLSSGDVWQQVVEHFRPRYQCHVLTLAGFAGVPPVDHPSRARVRADLLEVHPQQLASAADDRQH